jgi:FkbM family methyltransferase
MVIGNKGWAGVTRGGGIGDNIVTSSVLPGLKKRYGHVEVISASPHHVVFENNPYIDKLSVHAPEDIPLESGPNWHWIRSKEFEFYINLSHSIEFQQAFFSSQYQFQWPKEARHKIANRSYLEVAHDIALIPYDEIAPAFYPTKEEVSDAQAIKQKIGGHFIAWVIKGTRCDKIHPYAPSIIAKLIQEIKLPVVLMGSSRELELANLIRADLIKINGDANGLRRAITEPGDEWPIRRSLTFAQQADLVIGPDTGVLWACAMRDMPKIVMLSHASPENITKYWVRTSTLHADVNRVDCWPCHRLHDNMVTCRQNEEQTGAACISDISVKSIVQEAHKLLATGTVSVTTASPKQSTDICTYKHGRLIYFPGDPYMGKFLSEHGEYSEGEVDLFRQILQPDDCVIEVGANIGCHTIPLARMCRSVIAIEPQTTLFNTLCGNLALNDISNVQAINAAAGSEVGSCVVPIVDYQALGVNFGGISMLPAGSSGQKITMMMLVDLRHLVTNLKLIKADVEGMEWNVLMGAWPLISEHRPYLYLEDDREDKRERLHALLREMNYRIYQHHPPYVIGHNNLVSLNLFCVPEEKELDHDVSIRHGLTQ